MELYYKIFQPLNNKTAKVKNMPHCNCYVNDIV